MGVAQQSIGLVPGNFRHNSPPVDLLRCFIAAGKPIEVVRY